MGDKPSNPLGSGPPPPDIDPLAVPPNASDHPTWRPPAMPASSRALPLGTRSPAQNTATAPTIAAFDAPPHSPQPPTGAVGMPMPAPMSQPYRPSASPLSARSDGAGPPRALPSRSMPRSVSQPPLSYSYKEGY